MGYSAGAQSVGRTLYAANPNPLLANSKQYIAKVNRVVFAASIFGFPTEETPPPGGSFATFPLHVFVGGGPGNLPPDREAACTGRVVPGSREQVAAQNREEDPVGAQWGGTIPGQPTGVARSPVFASSG